MPVRVLVVDNYDSFVYNLVQALGELGAAPVVRRNDEVDAASARALGPDAVLLSPGPGRPEEAGATLGLVEALAGTVPILGVCLGHQAIGQAFGAKVVAAPALMHGKASEVTHCGTGIFEGIESPMTATRYHSLVVTAATVPDELEVTATAADGVVMGLRHRALRVEGVQFHPESILTPKGPALLANWLGEVARHAAPAPA